MHAIEKHRPLLFSLAYDMVGEVQEAEDIVQDVFESWYSKQPEVEFPKAYLSRAVVNKSIDRLRALKKEREAYKGTWLPVPVVVEPGLDDRQSHDPLPFALMNLLEELNPVERAAFILRQAFDFPYNEISEMCEVTEDNARQLVHRAAEKLQRPKIATIPCSTRAYACRTAEHVCFQPMAPGLQPGVREDVHAETNPRSGVE